MKTLETLLSTSSQRIARKNSRAKVHAFAMASAAAPHNSDPQRICTELLKSKGREDFVSDYLRAMSDQVTTGTMGLDAGERWTDEDLEHEIKKIAEHAEQLSPQSIVRQLVAWTLRYARETERRQPKRDISASNGGTSFRPV